MIRTEPHRLSPQTPGARARQLIDMVNIMDSLTLALQGSITISAVVVGAVASFLVTQRVDRARWTREQVTRSNERKLQVYTEYASSVKMSIIRSKSIPRAMGPISPSLTPMSREDGLPLLALDEDSRSEKFESVMMIGGPDVITAARKWHGISSTFQHWAMGTEETSAERVEPGGVAWRHKDVAISVPI